MNCPKCGRTCQLDDFFCARCGAKLQHDNVTFDEPEERQAVETQPEVRQEPRSDLRPLSANPVRPVWSAAEQRETPVARTPRKPLFEGYEPLPEEAFEDENGKDDVLFPKAENGDEEPTAIYRRHRNVADSVQADMDDTKKRKKPMPVFAMPPAEEVEEPEEEADEFGWDDEPEEKPARKRGGFLQNRKNRRKQEEAEFEEEWENGAYLDEDDQEDEEEELVEEKPVRRPATAPRRKPLPDLKKPVSHIRPVSQDRPREDPVFLFDDELEEEEERGGSTRLHLKILAVLTLLALVVFGIYFFKFTDTGRRIQAMIGISDQSEDYILLGNYHMERASFSEAATAYYSAFLLDQGDYDLALRVAEGLKQATDYDRAIKLYMYLMDNFTTRGEAADRLLKLYQELGWTENYEDLMNKLGRTIEESAPPQPENTPAPAQQASVPQGSFAGPTVSVPGGTYPYTVQLTLNTVAGAEIYYTLDGSQPTTQSTLYTGIILLDESKTYNLRAIAVLEGDFSYELNETYVIQMN